MIVLIIIVAYIASVFLCRWIEIQYMWWQHKSSYKMHLNPLLWFFSFFWIIITLMLWLHDIIYNARRDLDLNNFMKWFLVSRTTKTKKDKKIDDVFKNLFES